MKAIMLYAPALDNQGQRRDAGETVLVGQAKDRITADRAAALVKQSAAAKVR